MRSRFDDSWLPLAFALTAAIGMFFGYKVSQSMSNDQLVKMVESNDLQLIQHAQDIIENNYYGDIDTASYVNTVVDAMTEHLDEYSNYFDSRASVGFQHVVNGTYRGVGLDYIIYHDSIYITKVIKDSPGEMNDIRPGDVIMSVFNDSVDAMVITDIQQAVKDWDTINLTLFRYSDQSVIEKSLAKTKVSSSSIRSKLLGDGSVCYISIPRFGDNIFLAFMEELDYYKNQGIDISKLIIDLRNNPGGLLDETVKILNQLISEANKTIVSTIDAKGKVKDYKSNGRSFLSIEDIVILINEVSASASEIFAGSLQDHKLATIVGETSYGKGKIQQQFKLNQGASLNLTVGEYILPSGKKISKTNQYNERNGVIPDIVISDTCQSGQHYRYTDEYAFLIKHGVIDKSTLGIEEMLVIMRQYQDYTHSDTICSVSKVRKMATLLWQNYQSDLDMSAAIAVHDKSLEQAMKLVQ